MLTSLRGRLAAALFALLLAGGGGMALILHRISESADDLLEETSLDAQARTTLQAVRPAGAGGRVVVRPPRGWREAYASADGAFFTLYAADGRELARSPNLAAPLPPPPLAPGRDVTALALAGPDQRLMQAVRGPGGRVMVVARVNPGVRRAHRDDVLPEAAPLLMVVLVLSLALVLVAVVAEWSLAPLRRAAGEARAITPAHPERRLSSAGLPQEARPLAEAVNSALDRVSRALAAERRFIADAAHALRTPLTVLDLRLQALEAGPPAGDCGRLHALRRDLDAVIALAAGLLRLSREDAAPAPGAGTAVNLARTARGVAAELAPLFAAAGRDLVVEAPDQLTAAGDEEGWRVAVAALLDNALTHGAGTVTLHASALGGAAVLRVGDEGEGVPPALSAQVFDRFFKRDGASPGAGLGLAVVRRFAERLGGVAAFSAAAEVSVTVPLALALSVAKAK